MGHAVTKKMRKLRRQDRPDPDAWKRHAQRELLDKMATPTFALIAASVIMFIAAALSSCAGVTPAQRTVIHGTLGGLYGACQAVDADNATWRHICAAVDKALPFVGALGAGDAELPPDVAARPIELVIGE